MKWEGMFKGIQLWSSPHVPKGKMFMFKKDYKFVANNIYYKVPEMTIHALPFNGGGVWFFDGQFFHKNPVTYRATRRSI